MIITEKVKVKVISTTLKHYQSLGYDVKQGNTYLEVPVNHLTEGSKIEVLVKCDICDSEPKMLTYKRYITNVKSGSYYACSRSCAQKKIELTNIGKYGVKNPFESKEVKEKIKQTNIKNLGTEYPSQNSEVRNKVKKTLMDNYGVENPMDSAEIKQRVKDTNNNRYGFDSYMQIPEVAKEAGERFKETVKEKYNVENIMKLDGFKEKRKGTYLMNYGVDHYAKSEESKINQSEVKFRQLKTTYPNIHFLYKDGINSIVECDKGCDHNFTIKTDTLFKRIKYNVTLCTVCNDPNTKGISNRETQLYDYIVSILAHDIEIIRSYHFPKTNGKELDIYIPSMNIAFEFNGLYYHSEEFRDKDYHLNKTLLCKEQGIELIHIWEDDWLYRNDIIKSIIKNRLKIITSNKIYGRNTIIKEVLHYEAKTFLNENHIQGHSNSTTKLGLYIKDTNELVSLMTFGWRSINGTRHMELIRFVNKKDYIVIGAASKLFQHYINSYAKKCNVAEIISFADISIFNGNLYNSLGFTKSNHSMNYWWVIDGIRYHRYNYNKKNLIKKGYDKNMTGDYIMINELGAKKIWGCGMDRYVYKINI